MAKLISQSCGELQPAVCLPRGYGLFEGDPSTRGRLTSLRNKPQQKQPRQLSASILGLNCYIVNVYSYHLMVKSVSFCCVRGRHLFSNPVTMKFDSGTIFKQIRLNSKSFNSLSSFLA